MENLIDNLFERVVERRAVAGAKISNRGPQLFSIVGEFRKHVDFRGQRLPLASGIETNDCHAIAGAQVVNERGGCSSNQGHVRARRSGRVQQERDFERRFRGRKVCDALLLTVFEKQKIFRVQSS